MILFDSSLIQTQTSTEIDFDHKHTGSNEQNFLQNFFGSKQHEKKEIVSQTSNASFAK